MSVRYHQRRDMLVPDYQCVDENIQRHAPPCQTIPGHSIDEAISQLLLDTVTPLALEVALTVQAELEARADEADTLRASHVERARQHAELARRRYLAVDPDNRLVADTPRSRLERHPPRAASRPRRVRPPDRRRQHCADEQRKAQIRQLAADFPALWSDPATPARERKRIARLLIEDVTINKTDQIHLHVRFRGGQTTSLTLPLPTRVGNSARPRRADRSARPAPRRSHRRRDRRQLNGHGPPLAMAARSPARIVKCLGNRHRLPSHADRLRARGLLTLNEIADQLGVHHHTIKALAPRRPAHIPQGQRQERAALRPTRPPATPDSSNTSAGASPTENSSQQTQEVHYETNALS